ncbi:ATP-binding cassette domain-containing protein [Microtetraspora niveoalba]|uniref:ATP-binding cassette domain-containing protein n=1 Tax=Microtetraspora niveoalba TaxID=46175 RepID=UPI000AFA1BA0|nr:ATP-binding cassette domain-containing protein [Microtetraspora niveoalba]
MFPGAEVVAKDLTLKGGHGVVYSGVSLTAKPAGLAAVAGAAGSGRTSLLLTLAGRMKPTSGALSVGGQTAPRRVQRIAALGLTSGVNELDGALSVREHLHERLGPWGPPWRRGRSRAAGEALARAGLDLSALPGGERTLARALTRDQAVRLGIALALLDRPGLLLVDDLDLGLPEARADELWRTLRDLCGAGLTVVASCTGHGLAVRHADAVVDLP